ncbi:MAG: hypothetical protein WC917_04810 [Bacilli bacterium]|jgi:hypothetical protein
MLKQDFEVSILINGNKAKEYFHKGKTYIEGRKNTNFSILIKNNSYQKKLFIPTIDGISVLDGKLGDYSSGGYIVPGNKSITIEGWRISDNEVASFYFSSPEKSYGKQISLGDNLGVIGVAVFNEKHKPVFVTTTSPWGGTTMVQRGYNYEFTTRKSTWSPWDVSPVSLCASITSPQEQKLGTGWGDNKESIVTTVSFEKEDYPEGMIEIFYNTKDELDKAGITKKKEPLYVTPQAFPNQYCKPPKQQ